MKEFFLIWAASIKFDEKVSMGFNNLVSGPNTYVFFKTHMPSLLIYGVLSSTLFENKVIKGT